jgi:hypothetical protein
MPYPSRRDGRTVTPHFRPSLRDFPGKSGASWRPSSELLGYYHMSLRDKMWVTTRTPERPGRAFPRGALETRNIHTELSCQTGRTLLRH